MGTPRYATDMRYTFVGTRRAVALSLLGVMFTTFGWLGLLTPPEFRPLFLGLCGCYFLAFLGIAGGYFWGRWVATGIGYSGAMSILAVGQVEDPWPIVIWSGAHTLVILALAGRKMAEAFELREEWRKRWNLDEAGVKKIGGAVTSIASSLPLILAKLLFRPEGMLALAGVAAVVALLLLIRVRTAGVFAAATASVLVLLSDLTPVSIPSGFGIGQVPGLAVLTSPLLSAALSVALLVPLVLFLVPMMRYLRSTE